MNHKKTLDMYSLASELFPLCRSITGKGNRQTLQRLQKDLPQLTIHEVPTDTKVFDWAIPKEWQINDAYIEAMSGQRIIDFKDNNLHVLGYSAPINKVVTFDELKEMLYTLPEQPKLIPYVTSYYKERSGFCLSYEKLQTLKDDKYRVVIDSKLFNGSLTYGELILPGRSKQEVFFSTYICHPSLANNELSGICVATALSKWLAELTDRRFTYRIIFIPETIGAITYLQKNLTVMKNNIIAGYNITCVGDNNTFSYLASRQSNTLADKTALHILNNMHPNYTHYSYLDRGSDERQYCAPGIDLPVCSVMRSKYGTYPQYHTSADNLDFISAEGLEGSLAVYMNMVKLLENNYLYQSKCLGEPQLGKRGLYPTESFVGSANHLKDMLNFLAYADGNIDLITLAEKINCFALDLLPIIKLLQEHDLIGIANE